MTLGDTQGNLDPADLVRRLSALVSQPLTRFAPAPTGQVHLGHVVNAVYVWGLAGALGGRVLLRVENHDRQRSKAEYERDLLDDVIPAIEARYSVQADREHRALAGLSMGGGQSLNFGLAHLDTFAWVGGFSSAPNTKPPEQLLSDPAAASKRLKLLWLSCGNKDGLIRISQGVHAYLKEKDVPHIWHVDGNGHDATHWKNNLWLFAQRIFK